MIFLAFNRDDKHYYSLRKVRTYRKTENLEPEKNLIAGTQNKFNYLQEIYQSEIATVYVGQTIGQTIDTNEKVVVKVFSQVYKSDWAKERVFQEVNFLNSVKNNNIIQLKDWYDTEGYVALVYEYCNGGTLKQLLDEKKKLTEKESLDISKQILNAYKDLKRQNILHRDIKPENILINNGIIKLADFGLCKKMNYEHAKTCVGSLFYLAPEIFGGSEYDAKVYICALRITLYQMLYGNVPFEGNNALETLKNISNLTSE